MKTSTTIYQKLRTFLSIFVLSILILNVSSCFNNPFKEKTDDSSNKGLLLYALTIFSYYNNCPQVNAVLDSGTHTIDLADGQEYWFDITAKGDKSKALTSAYQYKIEMQYEPSNTLYGFDGNCFVKSINPIPQYTPINQVRNDPTNVGGFFRMDGLFPPNDSSHYYLRGIKLQGSTGTVIIKVP